MADNFINEIVSEQAFKDVERLQEIMAATLKTFEDSASSVKEFDAALRSAKSIPELNKAIADNIKLEKEMVRQQQEIEKLNKQKVATERAVEALSRDRIKTETEALKLMNLKNKESEKSAKQARDEADAYVRLKKEYNQVAAEAKRLTVEYGANNEKAAEATKRAKALHDQLLAVESAVGQNQRNVGNYPESARIIVEAMERARKKVAEVGKSFGPMTPEAQAARKEFDALDRITQNPQFLNIAAKAGDSTKELRLFTKQLVEMEDAGLKNTDVYRDLQHRLAQLTDQIGDTRAEIKALSSDTRGFDLFAGAVNFAADAFQTFAGAAALAGKSEEETAQATKTLIAIQSVSNGVKGIANELTTKGTFANKAYAFVMKQVAILTSGATSATQKLGAAMKTIGIGLIIAGIAYLIDKLDVFGDTSEKAEEETKKLTDAIEQQRKAVDRLNSSLDASSKLRIEKIKQDGLQRKQLQSDIDKEIADEEIATKEKQLKILEAQEKRSFAARVSNEMQLQRDLQKAREVLGKNVDESDISKKGKEDLAARRKALAEQNQIDKDAVLKQQQDLAQLRATSTTKVIADEKELAEKRAKANKEAADALLQLQLKTARMLFDVQQQELRNRIDYQSALINNDKLSYEKRFAATQAFYDLSLQLAEKQKAFELREVRIQTNAEIAEVQRAGKEKGVSEKLINDQVAAIRAASLAKQKEIQVRYTTDVIGLDKDSEEQRRNLREKAEEEANAHRESIHETEMQEIQNQYDAQLLALDRKFAKGKISEEDYNKKRLLLQVNLQAALLQADINYTKETIALAEARARATGNEADIDAVTEAKKKLAALEIQLQQTVADFTKQKSKEKLEDIEKVLTKVADIGSKVTDVISGLLNASEERDKNRIQKQIDDIDRLKEKKLEELETFVGTEQEKADRIKVIESKAQSDREALERKQRQAEERRARFDKAANIARIVVETALAVVHQLASGDPFTATGRAIAAGLFGAAQLAVAIATPIPRYSKGRKGGKAEWALTGEAGPERIERPDGTSYMVDRPTITFLEKDAKVIPNHELNDRAIRRAALSSMSVNQGGQLEDRSGNMEAALERHADRLVRAYASNRSTVQIINDWKGSEVKLYKMNSWTKWVNDNITT
jgi:hypothetical protein